MSSLNKGFKEKLQRWTENNVSPKSFFKYTNPIALANICDCQINSVMVKAGGLAHDLLVKRGNLRYGCAQANGRVTTGVMTAAYKSQATMMCCLCINWKHFSLSRGTFMVITSGLPTTEPQQTVTGTGKYRGYSATPWHKALWFTSDFGFVVCEKCDLPVKDGLFAYRWDHRRDSTVWRK